MQESSVNTATFKDIFGGQHSASGKKYINIGRELRSLKVRDSKNISKKEITQLPAMPVVTKVVKPEQTTENPVPVATHKLSKKRVTWIVAGITIVVAICILGSAQVFNESNAASQSTTDKLGSSKLITINSTPSSSTGTASVQTQSTTAKTSLSGGTTGTIKKTSSSTSKTSTSSSTPNSQTPANNGGSATYGGASNIGSSTGSGSTDNQGSASGTVLPGSSTGTQGSGTPGSATGSSTN
jgi:hypothetical protein